MMRKRICAISVDVDTLEDYVSSYGHKGKGVICDEQVYSKAIPRILDLFDRFGVKATFFVVGRDIQDPQKTLILKEMIKRGHEIANHTMSHIYPFSFLPKEKKRSEIVLMQKIAEDVLQYKVRGFRAPGYGIDGETLSILEEEGYAYDSSVHPTCFMLFLNMSVLFFSSGKKMRPETKSCFHFVAPLGAYTPSKNFAFIRTMVKRSIVEVPVTATPYFRMPFFGTFHLMFGAKIFDIGYPLLRKSGLDINYEIHAIDLLNLSEDNLDKWFKRQPAINVPVSAKEKIYSHIIESFSRDFEFEPIIVLAKNTGV